MPYSWQVVLIYVSHFRVMVHARENKCLLQTSTNFKQKGVVGETIGLNLTANVTGDEIKGNGSTPEDPWIIRAADRLQQSFDAFFGDSEDSQMSFEPFANKTKRRRIIPQIARSGTRSILNR
mmetsp:Transcript_65310/g.102824  ORF Transcript_65310/g.102824 Transcript_65310/m.102824 type:complete len:122 (-) Transcript_65310:115-480(-)